MLTGSEIKKRISENRIQISNFTDNQLNPNSYNVKLNPIMEIYKHNGEFNYSYKKESQLKCVVDNDTQFMSELKIKKRLNDFNKINKRKNYLDMKKNNETLKFSILNTGFLLIPGVLYLGSTIEKITAIDSIPNIDGRSSIGRLGINVHSTAGIGDIGFSGYFTLEISCIEPVIIYPYVEIAQVTFNEPTGNIGKLYNGKYQNNKGVQPSMLYKDFIK